MPGAQGQAGKLPYQVRLLVGERCPREQRKGVSTVLGLNTADTVLDAVERRGPVGLAKSVCVTDKGGQEPVRVATLEVALDPFGTEHAPVHRELFPGLETDNGIPLHLELDTTLHTAKAAMRLDETVRLPASLPSARRGVMEMGTVLLREVRERLRRCRHKAPHPNPLPEGEGTEGSAACTMVRPCHIPTCRRRQRG